MDEILKILQEELDKIPKIEENNNYIDSLYNEEDWLEEYYNKYALDVDPHFQGVQIDLDDNEEKKPHGP